MERRLEMEVVGVEVWDEVAMASSNVVGEGYGEVLWV